MSGGTWVRDLADWLYATPAEALPAEALHVASRQTLDSVACAPGAAEHEAAPLVLGVVRALGGTAESSLIGQPTRSSALNAILYNGTLIRALDANDIFLRGGPGGHPSDNVAVALAFAERQRASGPEYLRAVVLGYELYWRLREHLYRAARGYPWDHTSVSGLVGAAMAGLLLRLEPERLAQALAIGGTHVHALSEVRRGEISMLKASANAIAAQVGAQGALLAEAGMSGPAELFEGDQGLLAALGLAPTEELCAALVGPPERWRILDVSIKPFPAIGTSQGVLAATLELVREHRLRAAEVESVEVRFADLPVTHEHLADPARRDPRTRETADHSLTFLVAAAIEDGDLGPRQYADERWLRPSTRELMVRVSLLADPALNPYAETEYPAVVAIATRDGRTLRREMLHVPGGPSNPISDRALGEKLRRFAGPTFSPGQLAALEARLLNLEQEADMAEVGALLRGE